MDTEVDGAVWVTFAAIEDAAAQAGATNRAVQTLLDDLYRRLQPMVATWSGGSAEAFQYQHRLWAQASDDLNSVLGHISALLLDSLDAYSSAETTVADLWAGSGA
ncbi:MAG TPA: WXG100 family type VII secretion target [Actinospica sp.]|jgi:WXG100 family type VII secretion target|nr:WXG100 family type VII secretion target [Actinospica sp.]